MAVAWRRARTPSLDSQKWKALAVNGQKYLIKVLFDDQGYHVMISDLSTIWEEDPGAEKILRRGRSLNPNVEVPLPVLLSNLSANIEDPPAAASFTVSPDDTSPDSSPPDTVTLTLHTTLSSLPFTWEFVCTKAPPKALSCHLVEPLLCMVGELQRRQLELNKLLTKKDKEIQDYKDQGTLVSRRYLETAPFDAKAFANEMITSSHFEMSAQQPLAALSEPAFHELYRDIALIQKWAAKKDDLVTVEGGGDLDSATTGTWAGKIPASLLPSVPPASAHPPSTTTAAKSPEKSKSSAAIEDSEQERREALKRKLEEDKSKAKKKKKKLI